MQHVFLTQQFAQRIAVRIVVDDRERCSGVAESLWRLPGVSVAIRRLELGDYQVSDSLIVERKTLADFARSVRDCRLFTQVGRLTRQHTMRACLILEGTSDRCPQLAIPKPALQGALITVTLVFGLPVLRSETPEETADLILYAADQLKRRQVRPPRRRGFKVTGNRRRQILSLQAIPEVGPKKAELLLNEFGTPAGIAVADIEQIEAVDGIGPDTARGIYRVFHEGRRTR
jgi:DNA excision repair protein ERCC-4